MMIAFPLICCIRQMLITDRRWQATTSLKASTMNRKCRLHSLERGLCIQSNIVKREAWIRRQNMMIWILAKYLRIIKTSQKWTNSWTCLYHQVNLWALTKWSELSPAVKNLQEKTPTLLVYQEKLPAMAPTMFLLNLRSKALRWIISAYQTMELRKLKKEIITFWENKM